MVWHRIHQGLLSAWQRAGSSGDPPPTPLILAGWVYSNDAEKHARWQATVDWAVKSGLSSQVVGIPDADMYQVDRMTSCAVGPSGGPTYLPRSYEPKPALSKLGRDAVLATLVEAWETLAGPELQSLTRPLRLTGRKGRRLLVSVVATGAPPWGGWQSLASGPARRSFTEFRQRINARIAPHAVDHIDFVEAPEVPDQETRMRR